MSQAYKVLFEECELKLKKAQIEYQKLKQDFSDANEFFSDQLLDIKTDNAKKRLRIKKLEAELKQRSMH